MKQRALPDPPRSRQARGKPKEAAGEVRTLLALIEEDDEMPTFVVQSCQNLMQQAISGLTILDPKKSTDTDLVYPKLSTLNPKS